MIPNIEPNSKIENYLAQAEKESFPYAKVHLYLKAAKMQCKCNRIEDAKKTMEVAGSYFESVDSSRYIKSLLERAKVSALIDNQKVPKELKEADEYAQEAIKELEAVLEKSYSAYQGNFGRLRPDFVELARQIFSTDPEKANSYLNTVLKWENEYIKLDYSLWEFDGGKADLKLVKFYQMTNQSEKCLEVVKKIEGYVPKIMGENKVGLLLPLAKIIFSVDKDYGKKLLSSTLEIIENNPGRKDLILNLYKEKLEEVQQLYS
jgi:hypothetical protein